MGTEKRERQKANRQLKLEEIARQQTKQQAKRRGLQIGLLVGGAIALVAVVFLLSRGGNDTSEAQATTTVAAAAIPGDTTVASETTVAATAPAGDQTPAPTLPGASVTGETECPAVDGTSPRTISFEQAPPMCIDAAKKYSAVVVTNLGEYTVEFDAVKAPKTVNNFVTLARYHYFDGVTCHRAIPGFVVQCGDPDGTGSGGPGYSFDDELPAAGEYELGSLAMANSGPNTNGSQFFVITGDQGIGLPPSYSLFGKVTDGLDVVTKMDALGNNEGNGVPPLGLIQIVSVTVTEV